MDATTGPSAVGAVRGDAGLRRRGGCQASVLRPVIDLHGGRYDLNACEPDTSTRVAVEAALLGIVHGNVLADIRPGDFLEEGRGHARLVRYGVGDDVAGADATRASGIHDGKVRVVAATRRVCLVSVKRS